MIRLSALFDAYPKVFSSGVEIHSSQSTNYIVTSEGTELRTPEDLRLHSSVRRMAWRPMGHQVRDALMFQAFSADGLPSEDVLTREIKAVGEHVTALSQAPAGRSLRWPRVV